jgi:hypothetical protein
MMTGMNKKRSRCTWRCCECKAEFRRAMNSGNAERCLYCSRQCYGIARRSGRHRENVPPAVSCVASLARAVDRAFADLFEWMGRWERSRPRPRATPKRRSRRRTTSRPCDGCGVDFMQWGSSQRFCSVRCAADTTSSARCGDCGSQMEVRGCGRPRKRCAQCRRRTARVLKRSLCEHRKRCRLYGGHYNPKVTARAVFDRDSYRCHLCRKRCLRKYASRDPRSPTVDHHPIPLSRGGDHDWHNVRCACAECNSRKGARWSGQRRLPLALEQ